MSKKHEAKKKPSKTGYEPAKDRLLDLAPDQLPLTERRANYLADRSGVAVEKLAGKPLAEVHEALRWKIDPQHFFFRRVCGRVVTRDLASGELLPVAGATVHVEDTDCNYLGYFPDPLPWVWLYPFGCRREVIATVVTDECGEFCVYLPLWDIDRILRWRRTQVCYWEWFRPRVHDLLEAEPELADHRLRPDPSPLARIAPESLERVRNLAGDALALRLEMVGAARQHGEFALAQEAILDEPLFAGAMPPPLPEALRRGGEGNEEERQRILGGAGDQMLSLNQLDFQRFVGPFRRCNDLRPGTWHTVLDVPDITFRVTQDYDGDGVEEVIYSEGHFDVRWNSGSIPNIVLEASGQALPALNCGPPRDDIPCGNVPSIESAGYLDLEPPYHDDTLGYGVRVNRPSPTGDYPPPPSEGIPSATAATAPYAGNLNLHGCIAIGDASHYRLRFEYRAEATDPWGPTTVLKNVVWTAPRQGGGAAIPFVPDTDGWYPRPNPDELVHPNWLLPWNTTGYPDGLYRLELELGTLTAGSINPQSTSAPRVFRIDNSAPIATLVEVRWRLASVDKLLPWTSSNSTAVLPAPPDTCPVIHRPTGKDIHLRVVWTAAAKHLRNAQLSQSGCGGGNLELLDGGPEAYRHWHQGPADNNVAQTNTFLLRATRPPGCYTLGIQAWSRAFNPQDSNAESTRDWWVNRSVRWTSPSRAISVVDI